MPADKHAYYLSRCLQLARLGHGRVAPNPLVGSVLVYKEEIIGEGYHAWYGGTHAEVNCLQQVSAQNRDKISKATLYVSLEPCNHQGKTPPCTELILRHQIPKVVIGCKDYSAHVNGKGINRLQQAGVEVIYPCMETEVLHLNRRFFTYHQKKRPYLILKWAQSREGFIGKQAEKIILSCPESLAATHRMRAREAGIWVGFQTALIDNPQLNVRFAEGPDPVRILYDAHLDLPDTHYLMKDDGPTWIFNKDKTFTEGPKRFIQIPEEENKLNFILTYLYHEKILSVLVEGGRALLQQLIDADLWDEALCFETATSLPEGIAAPILRHAGRCTSRPSGADQLIRYQHLTAYP